MGNPHAKTVSDIEIGWVAGFFDGEGHIGIVNVEAYKKQKQPRAIFTGTNVKSLIGLVSVLERADIAHYVRENYSAPSLPTHWKPKWTVTILGWKRLQRFLQWITPYLVTKQEECELMLDFANRRLLLGKKPWEELDYELARRVADYSRRPKPNASTT